MQMMAESLWESALGQAYDEISLESNISRRDLGKSKKSLRKVQRDVEGTMGPYYWKQMIRTRIKED